MIDNHERPNREQTINAGGVIINTTLAQELTAKIFDVNLPCKYGTDTSLSAIGSYEGDQITISSEIPALITCINYLH